ncbi:hypothetical protein F5882DRAFT_497360 [Hyaloscypha sp. PMI_1271]|nr:hypothetical protein F5882DRAFT_497360 [Hyaloscypha sp. PMI_1271]
MSLVGGLSQSPETTQAVRGSAASRLRGSPTAHKSAFGETWRGWPRERPDERDGPRLALWGPDALKHSRWGAIGLGCSSSTLLQGHKGLSANRELEPVVTACGTMRAWYTPGGCHRLVELSPGFAVADRLALRCPHLGMPSSLARDVLHRSADSMLLRAERGAKELPGRDSTAPTVSTHPATIDKEVAARFSCPARMRSVWTLEATDPKKPDPNAPPPEPSQWFVAIAVLVGRPVAEVRPGTVP